MIESFSADTATTGDVHSVLPASPTNLEADDSAVRHLRALLPIPKLSPNIGREPSHTIGWVDSRRKVKAVQMEILSGCLRWAACLVAPSLAPIFGPRALRSSGAVFGVEECSVYFGAALCQLSDFVQSGCVGDYEIVGVDTYVRVRGTRSVVQLIRPPVCDLGL